MAVEDADLSEQFQLASIIEKLVETFNTSNDKTIEDVTKRPIQSSVFNNKLNSGALQQVENSITQSLNGGEPGLYALILRSQEIEAKAEGTSTSWWSIFLDIAGEEESEDLEPLKALDSPIVTEIIEDRPEFTAVILASMVARSALNQFSTCSTDSSLSGVTHPTGDTLGESQQPEDELGESQQPEDGS